ncbi:hypothetical protein ACVOMT_03410 [Sphingomonas panni]
MVEIGPARKRQQQLARPVIEVGAQQHFTICERLQQQHDRIAVERRVEVGPARLQGGDQLGEDHLERQLLDQLRGGQARQVDGGGGGGKVHRRPCRRRGAATARVRQS